MNIQEAIKTGKPIRRENWVNKEFRYLYEWTIDELDILSQDWEVEPEKNDIELILCDSDDDVFRIKLADESITDPLFIETSKYGVTLSEENVDKLLTFLYNNTKIGKSRVIPF